MQLAAVLCNAFSSVHKQRNYTACGETKLLISSISACNFAHFHQLESTAAASSTTCSLPLHTASKT
eukprot:1504-Heterococcus_DN1.PRE.3